MTSDSFVVLFVGGQAEGDLKSTSRQEGRVVVSSRATVGWQEWPGLPEIRSLGGQLKLPFMGHEWEISSREHWIRAGMHVQAPGMAR